MNEISNTKDPEIFLGVARLLKVGLLKDDKTPKDFLDLFVECIDAFDKLGDDIIGIMLLGYCDLVATRKLLNPLEDNGVIKTYMEFILTVYFYRYKTDKEV